MKLEDYLQEIELQASPDVNQDFNFALKQVFSLQYFSKVEDTIKNKIKIVNKKMKSGAVAYYKGGNTIFISPEEYNKIPRDRRVLYLLHEFIHLLQSTKSFFILSKFRDLNVLGKKLRKIISSNLIKPMEVFLSKKNQKLASIWNIKKEVIPYLILNSIDWTAISKEGKQKVWEEMKRSGIFNMSHKFWTRRFYSNQDKT